MTITTTLTWTRYDGTPETLPKKGFVVLLVLQTRVYECTMSGHDDDPVWVWGFGDSKTAAIGDTWAYWPEAPEVRE